MAVFYLILDSLGSLSVDQGVPRLLKQGRGRTNVCNHDCHTVPTQSFFEQSSEFRVSIIDKVTVASSESVDTVSQGQQ